MLLIQSLLSKAIGNILRKGILLVAIVFFTSSVFNNLQAQSYRTKNSGNWNDINTWESSVLGLIWLDAVAPPNSNAGVITINAGHTVRVTGNQSLNKASITGILQIESGSLTINNQLLSTGELTIVAGGHFISWGSSTYSAEIKGTSPKIKIESLGKITVGNGGSISSDSYSGYATSTDHTWENNSIFAWNSSTALPLAGTFFPGLAAAVKPHLLINNTGGIASGSGSTVINGLLHAENSFTLAGAGAKSFRDGITGSGTITIPSSAGAVSITGTNAILGGRNLRIVTDKSIAIANGITIPADSSVILSTNTGAAFTGKGSNTFLINGSIDMGTLTIANTAGAVTINGHIKTSHVSGLEGGTISVSSIVNVNVGSTVEYNSLTNQAVTPSSVLEGAAYYNISFSGAGIKSLSGAAAVSNNVKISELAVVDALNHNLGSSSASFTMDGGRLQTGVEGLQPQMAGTYNLSAGVVQFARNSSAQFIRSGSAYVYHDVEIAGDQVSGNAGNDIYLKASSIFTIKSTGVFISETSTLQGPTGVQAFVMEGGSRLYCANEAGFSGAAIAGKNAAVSNSIENLSLMPGSNIYYNRSSGDGLQYISNAVPYQHLHITGSGNKIAPAGNLSLLGNLSKTSTSIYVHNNGRVIFSGNAGQVFSNSSGFAMLLKDVTNNSSNAGLTINGDSMAIAGALLLMPLSKLQLASGNIILKSTALATAQLLPVPAEANIINYTGTGRFIVERFLPAVKAWRLLATPVTAGAVSISDTWREANNNTVGYGTKITGPTGSIGMDAVSAGSSMKWYNMATNSYVFVTNTNDAIANKTGYMVYVRGDRATAIAAAATNTSLRIKGRLNTGDQTFIVNGNSSQSIGNPYASAIDFAAMQAATAGLASYYIAWDPSLNGSYGVGGFQTLSSVDGYKANAPASAGTSSLFAKGNLYPNIESGQAFFVYNNSASVINPVITESMKAAGSRLASREATQTTMEDRQFIRSRLLLANGEIADGNMVAFDEEFTNEYDGNDAIKFSNGGENFGLSRFGKKLVVEARNLLQRSDSIFYNMSNLKQQVYQLEIDPENMGSVGLQAWLVDQYLKKESLLNLSSINNIAFTIDANAASNAANRFYLVFKPMAVLPVTFISVTAQGQADRSIAVNWKVANEINIVKYEVARSANGSQFSSIISRIADNSNSYNKADVSPLVADNFYRIKAIGLAGDITYSDIVKVTAEKITAAITLTQVPVKNKQLSVRFEGQTAGRYSLQLINTLGQVIYQGNVLVNALSEIKQVNLPASTAAGTLQLSIRNTNGESLYGESIVIE